MRLSFAVILLLTVADTSRGQSLGDEVSHDTLAKYSIYDLDLPGPSFHADRRAKLLEQMEPGQVALFQAAPEQTRSNDVEYLYHQNPDFYYLTGCTEAGSALLISKDPIELSNDEKTQEILLVQKRDPAQETWTGHRLGPDGAKAVLKVRTVMAMDMLPTVLNSALNRAKTFNYSPVGEKERDLVLDTTLVDAGQIRDAIAKKYPQLKMDGTVRTKVHAMRQVKQPVELVMMRRAIGISNQAHNAVISQSRAGWHEFEIQALAESIFTKSGAEYTAYPCIVGSGPNSTVLHYESNRRQTQPGDFIEMDMGAEYHGYAADVTRSFPVSGRFTPEQRAIYELVLEAQDSGIKLCQVGNPFRSAHSAAVRVIKRGLIRLGIIKDSAEYRKYFMHGTSHYLGLDVHDAGNYGPLAPGNVLTVEPGIYIAAGSPCDPKWWNIGCRIEDDILVTDHGPENLSIGSPRTIQDLEKLMSRSK